MFTMPGGWSFGPGPVSEGKNKDKDGPQVAELEEQVEELKCARPVPRAPPKSDV